MKGSRRWVAGIVTLFVLLRVGTLTADAPGDLVSHYQDVASSVFDEGWWTANARELVTTGTLLGTGFDLFWVSPVFTALLSFAFAVLGPGLASARLVSVLLGAAGLVLLMYAGHGRPVGRVAGVLWSVSFAGALLGRLALPETAGTALGLAGAVCLLRRRPGACVAAGAFAMLAALVKPHFVFLVPAFLASAGWLAARRAEPWLRPPAWVLAGAVLPAALWGAWVAAHSAEALELMSFYLKDRWFAGAGGGGFALAKPALQVLVAGVVYRHPFFTYLPFAFVFAIAALPSLGAALVRPRSSSVPDEVVVFGVWAVAGGVMISTLPFQPFRYYLPLVPAVVYLAAWLLYGDGAEADRAEAPVGRPARWLRRGLTWAAGVALGAQGVFAVLHALVLSPLVGFAGERRLQLGQPVDFHIAPFLAGLAKSRSLASFAELPRELAYVAALALFGAVALLAGIVLGPWLGRVLSAGVERARRARTPLLVGAVLFQALLFATWFPGRAYTLPDMGRELDALVPAGATVSPAGTYTLTSDRRFDSTAVRDGRMFDAEGGADYFVVLERHPTIGVRPPAAIETAYPGSERVAVFELTGGYVYALYRAAR